MFIDERCRRVSIEWRKQKKLFMSHKRWSTTQLTRHRILQTLSIYISYGVRWFSENYTNCVERWRTTHTKTHRNSTQTSGTRTKTYGCILQQPMFWWDLFHRSVTFVACIHSHMPKIVFFSCAHFFWLLLLLFDVENVRLRSICLRHQSNHREYIEASIYIFVWRKVCFERGHFTHFIHKYHRFFPSNWSPTCAYSS